MRYIEYYNRVMRNAIFGVLWYCGNCRNFAPKKILIKNKEIMATIARSLTELIGHTPLLELTRIEQEKSLKARVLVKIESLNPARSVKDRVAYALITEAEKNGLIDENTTIIEPTNGNLTTLSAVRHSSFWHHCLSCRTVVLRSPFPPCSSGFSSQWCQP